MCAAHNCALAGFFKLIFLPETMKWNLKRTFNKVKIVFSTSLIHVQCNKMVTRVKKQQGISVPGITAAFMNIAGSEKELISKFVNQTIPQLRSGRRFIVLNATYPLLPMYSR